MLIGYARTVSREQGGVGLAQQVQELRDVGCEHVFGDDGALALEGSGWLSLLSTLKAGDVLVVRDPDRLTRNGHDLLRVLDEIDAMGVVVWTIDGQVLRSSELLLHQAL